MADEPGTARDYPQLWQNLSDEDVAQAVEAQLAPANLVLPPVPMAIPSDSPDKHFHNNESFWREALDERLRANATVVLHDFFLSEWFPRSPGLFHTEEALYARRDALFHVLPLNEEQRRAYEDTEPPDPIVYNLHGKSEMLRGGLGCIRLMPKPTENGTLWFVSASSTLSAHEGVPVAIRELDYARFIGYLAENGVMPCTLTGRLQFLPEPLLSLYRDYTDVPRLYLLVENIQPARAHDQVIAGLPLVSVAVTFQRSEYQYSTAYISFVPGANGSLRQRLPWLEYYVANLHNGTIVTDFDEQMTRFRGAVFSLDKVCNGRLSESEVTPVVSNVYLHHADIQTFIASQQKLEEYRFNVEGITMVGDSFSNIGAGAVIINRSTLSNAMNTVSNAGDADMAAALKQLGEAIEKSGNAAAAENFNAFNEELQQPEPRKNLLRSFWNGVVEALPNIVKFAAATAKIVTLFV